VIVVQSVHTSPGEPTPRVVVSEFLSVTQIGSEQTGNVKKCSTSTSLAQTLAPKSAVKVDGDDSDLKTNESLTVEEIKCSPELATPTGLSSTPSVEIKMDLESDDSSKRSPVEQTRTTEEHRSEDDVNFIKSVDETRSTARALKRKLDT